MVYDLWFILIVYNIFEGNINVTIPCHVTNLKTAAADVLQESLIKWTVDTDKRMQQLVFCFRYSQGLTFDPRVQQSRA